MNKKLIKYIVIFIVFLIITIVLLIVYFRKNNNTPNTPNAPPHQNSIDIEDQPEKTIQLVNNTNEDPLHIFLGISNDSFIKVDGNGIINDPVDFTKNAWDPIGSAILSEVIIPKNDYIVLQLPRDSQGKAFRVSPLKMIKDNNEFLKTNDTRCTPNRGGIGATYCKIAVQWPVLIEGGMDVVADASAVDGINFKLTYQLTTDNDKILTMDIKNNPCNGLDPKYQLDIGCRSPAKIDCDKNSMNDGQDTTADCKSGPDANQVCKFNDCSQKLFNIPDNLQQYITNYDKGNEDPSNHPPVKTFVEDPINLFSNSPQQTFCDLIHKDTGNFTPYCYDYNDTGSSPYLTSPYKIKLIVSNLI